MQSSPRYMLLVDGTIGGKPFGLHALTGTKDEGIVIDEGDDLEMEKERARSIHRDDIARTPCFGRLRVYDKATSTVVYMVD